MNGHEPSANILVVDDSLLSQHILKNLLTNAGYGIHLESAPLDGLAFAQENLPDLILLDIQMPGSDGYEICERLKADERTRDIPVIFISVLNDLDERVRGFQVGGVDYITKPFQQEEVLARINTHINLRQAWSRLERQNWELQREIAARQKTEKALRQNRALLNVAGKMAKVGGWELIAATHEITWTEQTYHIHEVPLDYKPSLQGAINFYHPQDRAKLSHAIDRALEKGEPYDMEIRFITAKGRQIWTRSICVPVLTDGKATKLQGAFQDITQRKQDETALRMEHERFVVIMDSLDALVYVTDLKTHELLFMNAAFRKIVGDRVGEACWRVLQTGQTEPCAFCTNDKLVDVHGQPTGLYIWEFQNTLNGQWYHCRDRAIRWPDGRLARLEIATNITVRKQAEMELLKAKEKAEVASRAKSEFLANMTHELRTPLNAILGFSQILAKSPNLDPDEKSNVEVIKTSGEHLLNMINDVLDMSKIEAGRMLINKSVFDLYGLLDDLKTMFFLKASEKNLDLVFERHASVPRYLNTDENKLRQILLNLLANAIKYTHDGGVIMRVRRMPDAYIQKSPMKSRNIYLAFEIEDTGEGIAADKHHNIFNAFVQAGASRGGTGLGLSISKQFVRLMGGDLRVQSEVGQGSVFKFTIQAEKADNSEIKADPTEKRVIALAPNQPRRRVLIADHTPSNRSLLLKMLALRGLELRECENGPQAVSLWETWRPHLIFMDMDMPNKSGYHAASQIKQSEKGRDVKIIGLTASALDTDPHDAVSAKCDDFLMKPIREKDIFNLLSKHLGLVFVHESVEATEPKRTGGLENVLTAKRVNALPQELCLELKKAAQRTDPQASNLAIARIRECDPLLSEALADEIDKYRFDIIQNLFEKEKVCVKPKHLP